MDKIGTQDFSLELCNFFPNELSQKKKKKKRFMHPNERLIGVYIAVV